MSLPPGFLDELRSRVSLAQVVGGRSPGTRARATPPAATSGRPARSTRKNPRHSTWTRPRATTTASAATPRATPSASCARPRTSASWRRSSASPPRPAWRCPSATPPPPPAPPRTRASPRRWRRRSSSTACSSPTARAAEARAYLDRRGLAPATRDRFEIGYAPDSRTALLEHLTGKGFPRERLVEAGLVGLPREGGSPYDRFRGRITFPIRDARGRAIAFGARAIAAGQEPKYLNSPDTPLFDKGRTLYNVGPARAAAAKAGTVIVTEGYMDVIALAQAGLDHAVAPLGTAITEAQLELLWKLAPEPVVALDGDPRRPRRRPAADRPRAAATSAPAARCASR